MDDALHAEMGGIEMGDIKIILALMFLGAILSDAGLKSVGELVIFISMAYGAYCYYRYCEKEDKK